MAKAKNSNNHIGFSLFRASHSRLNIERGPTMETQLASPDSLHFGLSLQWQLAQNFGGVWGNVETMLQRPMHTSQQVLLARLPQWCWRDSNHPTLFQHRRNCTISAPLFWTSVRHMAGGVGRHNMALLEFNKHVLIYPPQCTGRV